MSELLNVSPSPNIRKQDTTQSIMFDVAIALVPATVFGVYHFGIKALLIILISVITCVLTEYIYQNLMGLPVTVSDGSALVTGLLLALNLSASVPLWIPLLGGIFAILIVKQLFGGLGQNFMNPALAARCFLLISFGTHMTNFALDGVSGATPLAQLKAGKTLQVLPLFFGTIQGTIGEVSALAILIGAIYLLLKKVISIRIPACYLISFLIFLLLFGKGGIDFHYIGAHLFGGGLMLGAFFMATDYVTSPITKMGQIVYGVLLGILTGIFRVFGASAEGVSYAIIFGNLLVPLIEKVTYPKAFGIRRKNIEKIDYKEIIKNACILFAITLVAGGLLGVTYETTKENIEKQKMATALEAYQKVSPQAVDFGYADDLLNKAKKELQEKIDLAGKDFGNTEITAVVEARNEKEEVIGYAFSVLSHDGYGGDIDVCIGISLDKTITGVEIISLNETTGMGMRATEPAFIEQYKDKKVDAFVVTKTGKSAENEIDAISGATVTSNAVTNAVNMALFFVESCID